MSSDIRGIANMLKKFRTQVMEEVQYFIKSTHALSLKTKIDQARV
jgi:hypothetical protein